MTQALAPELRNLAGRQLGRYEVLTQLASGGMAGVYVARAKGVAGFERLVAVKVLHPHLAYEDEFISMFLDEARLAARIRHPNVVPTLDISDTDGDGFFLVMEYIEGDHLGALLAAAARANERVPTPVVARIVLDALNGLAAAHALVDEEGEPLLLVHRDISPHNVMVGTDGIGRLTDFGVAKAEKRLTSTRAGQFKGKLAYMAPEQASTGHADQRSDLFSMGVLVWESLTGRRLFRADNNAAVLTKILQDDIPMPSEVVPDLAPFDEVLAKALARDPEARFQTAEEMAEAIEAVARQHGGIANARAVAAEVRRLLSDKIEASRLRVKEATERLGRAEMTEPAMPLPRDGSLSSVSRSGPRPVPPDAVTATGSIRQTHDIGPPQELVVTYEEERSRMVPILLGVVAALVIMLGGVLLVVTRDAPEEAAGEGTTLPATTATEPAAAEPAAGAATSPDEAPSPAPEAEPHADAVEPPARAAVEQVEQAPRATESDPMRALPRRTRGARPEGAMAEPTAMTEPTPMVEATAMVEPPAMVEPRVEEPRPPRMESMRADDLVTNPYRQ
ncbi:MAG: protein kinase [Myxococcales bacterium]|nr:protein kinase [Myxococcales bacterium]